MANAYRFAIDDLKKLAYLRTARETLPQRIRIIDSELSLLRSSMKDSDPVKSSGGNSDDRAAQLVCNKMHLERRLAIVGAEISAIEQCLAALSAQEQRVLEVFFVEDARYAAEALADELHMDRATVYRIKEAALRKYEMACGEAV